MREHFPNDPTLSAFSRRFVQPGFDPTAIRPIISPAVQTRPKAMSMLETSLPIQDSPPPRAGQLTNSPKRALPLDDSDNDNERPRKLARGESPLKGAAGRRLEQQKRSHQPQGTPQFDHALPQQPPPTLPPALTNVLGILPKASLYPPSIRFIPEKMIPHVLAMDITKHNRTVAVGGAQPGPPRPMPPRPSQQIPPPMQQPIPQHPPSMHPMPTMGMPNPYSGGYSTFSSSSYNQPASPFPPQQQQVLAPQSNFHFPGPNGQAAHGNMGHGTGYGYGQGKLMPRAAFLAPVTRHMLTQSFMRS